MSHSCHMFARNQKLSEIVKFAIYYTFEIYKEKKTLLNP